MRFFRCAWSKIQEAQCKGTIEGGQRDVNLFQRLLTSLPISVVHLHVDNAAGLVPEHDHVAPISLGHRTQLCQIVICPP